MLHRNNASSRGATGALFMGIFPGASRNLITGNRVNDCAIGITDNSGNGSHYHPFSLSAPDTNSCF